jgi:hypothetical protein
MMGENEDCCRKSLWGSIVDSAKRLSEDRTIVPLSVQVERFASCKKCEHLQKPFDKCEVCGCFMRVKTQFSNMRCPLEEPRWVEFTPE